VLNRPFTYRVNYRDMKCGSKASSLWVKSYGVTIQMKATEQYFPVVLFIMLYKVVLTFESVGEILWCDHSNETSFISSTFTWYYLYLSILQDEI